MLAVVVRCALAAVLAGAALHKLSAPAASQDALATFGLSSPRARRLLWALLVAAELALAGGVAAGAAVAAYLAALLLLGFAVALTVALARGRGGEPCGCFGARSRVRPPGVARNMTLAAAFAAVPLVPHVDPSAEAWLAAGLGVALLAISGLAVALLALAREVGALRLALGPQSALELEHEGPELGSRSELIERFDRRPERRLALAVFTSEGCSACGSLQPAVEFVGRDPFVALRVFDEAADADAWRALDVPGSPYAVALGLDGTVLAKGTFNSLGQLESVLGAAERREREALGA